MLNNDSKLLIVINTLDTGGAERTLIDFVTKLKDKYNVSNIDIYLILPKGDMITGLPHGVSLLNYRIFHNYVSAVLYRLLNVVAVVRDIPYYVQNIKYAKHLGLKILWKVLADSCNSNNTEYDLAIAFLEGASTHYVQSEIKVRAKRRIAFVHVDYVKAGYNKYVDKGVYGAFDKIFCVSNGVRDSFLREYPEYSDKTFIFQNEVNIERVIESSKKRPLDVKSDKFDSFDGIRIITLARLIKQKGLDLAIDIMNQLVIDGYDNIIWHVFGEGEDRAELQTKINALGLRGKFILEGTVDNPYYYLSKSDIYVQCSNYEGHSIAVCEAQLVGLPVVYGIDNSDLIDIKNGETGIVVRRDSKLIAMAIESLLNDRDLMVLIGDKGKKDRIMKVKENTSMDEIVSLIN